MDLSLTNFGFVFAFVAARLLPLGSLFPVARGRAVPLRLRLVLVLVVSIMITPLYSAGGTVVVRDAEFAVALLRESLFGLALALSVVLLVGGLQLAGSVMSQLAGLSLEAEPVAPFGSTPIERLFGFLSIAIFLSIDGHRRVVDAILSTFRWVPPGTTLPSVDAAGLLADLLSHSFQLAVRLSAPVAFSLLVSTLIIGLVARSMPSVGALGIGLGINLAVLLIVLALSLQGLGGLFEIHLEQGFEHLLATMAEAVAAPEPN